MKVFLRYKKPIGLILAFSLLFSSCSYKITRQGYAPDPYAETDCHVVIKKHVDISDLEVEHKGSITLDDAGFTTGCKETRAHEILKEEACGVGANFVHIYEEAQPGMVSSCYRCAANLYYVNPGEMDLDPEVNLKENSDPYLVQQSEKNNSAITVVGYIAGFAIGYLIGYWLFGGFR